MLKRLLVPSLEGNLPRFFISQILYNLMFFMPIWVIFLQQKHGLSLTQVTLVDFAFWITMALTEVPTGAVADTIGRKTSLVIGFTLSAISTLLFGLTTSYPLLLVANSTWGIAITFISGADMALFYDTLSALGREDEYPRLRGRLSAVSLAATGVGNGLAGLLVSWNPTSPFALYAVAVTLGSLVVLQLKEPPTQVDPLTQQPASYAQILRTAWGAIRKSAGLRYTLVYSNLLPLANAAIYITFIQPHALAIGVPLTSIGVLVFGLSLVRMAGSASADRIVRITGEWRWLVLAPVLVVLGVSGLALIPNVAGVGVYAVAAFTSVATRPLLEDLMLRGVPGNVRATVLSADNLIFRLMLAGIEPIAGVIADHWELPVAFLAMAGCIGLGMAVLLPLWRRATLVEVRYE